MLTEVKMWREVKTPCETNFRKIFLIVIVTLSET